MPLTDFTFRAEIDWCHIIIQTVQQTRGDIIKGTAQATNAMALRRRPGGVSNVFLVRWNDVRSWDNLEASVECVRNRFGLAVEPRVAAVEVSLDAWRADRDVGSMASLLATQYKFATYHPKGNHRRSVGWDTFGADASIQNIQRSIANGCTLYVGNRNADTLERIYVKRTDNGADLTRAEWRARREFTFRRDDVPFTNLTAARDFDWKTVARHFHCRKLEENRIKTALESLAIKSIPQIGQRGRPADSSRRVYDWRTSADVGMNKKIYEAFRSLRRRLALPLSKQRKARVITNHTATSSSSESLLAISQC